MKKILYTLYGKKKILLLQYFQDTKMVLVKSLSKINSFLTKPDENKFNEYENQNTENINWNYYTYYKLSIRTK
ncbi:hypothetical protein FLAVO9AF_130073 [Flavobacterium sp. 9AF]|nr:hypothetical protein FLAVO9AF_130073 [Flavobacterium sp. 9AF]